MVERRVVGEKEREREVFAAEQGSFFVSKNNDIICQGGRELMIFGGVRSQD